MVAYTARKNPLAMPTGAPAPAPAFDVSADAYQPGAMSAAPMTASPMTPSAGSPFSPPQGPPRNALLASALDGFQRGFAPAGFEKRETANKAAEGDKLKQTLALMQQQRALPEQQRGQWWQQNAPTISKIIGQDVSQMPLDVTKFSDQALDGQIAALSAQAGIGPVVPEPYTLASGAERRGANNEIIASNPIERASKSPIIIGNVAYDPVTYEPIITGDAKPENLPEGMWRGEDGKGPPQPIPGYVDMRTRIARGSQSPSSTADTYRPATPQDLASWGIPAGTAVKINNRTGEPQVISGAKPASEYTPTQQSKFIQQAQTLDSVDGALKAYTDLIDAAGPQLWTTGIGGDNPKAKQLDAARTAILIQAKELFNLGVLNGPDLEIISSAVPDVTGSEALGKSAASAKAQLSVLTDYISRGRNQIPTELLERARPNTKKTREGVPFLLAKPTNTAAAGVPDGVDPADWEFMTPEQKALFQ